MIFDVTFYRKPKNWIWLILIFDLFYKSIINFLHLPDAIVYFNDFACLVILHALIMHYRRFSSLGKASLQLVVVSAIFCETIISYCINIYSPLTYLWGFRILFRFIVFFFGCTVYVNQKMIDSYFKMAYIILLFSVPFATIQRLLGYDLDSVSAFFSEGKNKIGGSAGINIFMCIICTYYIVCTLNKTCPMYKLLTSVLPCAYIAAIAELKIFYVELLIIIFLAVMFTDYSVKKMVGAGISFLIIVIGIQIYNFYYGDRNSLNLASMLDYAGANGRSYGTSYSLNRLTAIPYVWKNILTDIPTKLFGLGIGYADNISSSFFRSNFMNKHGDLGIHLWGMSLELTNIGLIGILLYLLFFISIFIYACRKEKQNKDYKVYCVITKIMIVLTFVTLFYNTSLILDISAPFIFFVLAIPFTLKTIEGKNNGKY